MKNITVDKKTAIVVLYGHFCRLLLTPLFYESKGERTKRIELNKNALWDWTCNVAGTTFSTRENKGWEKLYLDISLLYNIFPIDFQSLEDKEVFYEAKSKELQCKSVIRRIYTALEHFLTKSGVAPLSSKRRASDYLAAAQHLTFMRMLLSSCFDAGKTNLLKQKLLRHVSGYAFLNKDPETEELLKNVCTFITFYPNDMNALDFETYAEKTKAPFPLDMNFLMSEIWYDCDKRYRKSVENSKKSGKSWWGSKKNIEKAA